MQGPKQLTDEEITRLVASLRVAKGSGVFLEKITSEALRSALEGMDKAADERASREAFEDEKRELRAQLDAGVLDVGQDDYYEFYESDFSSEEAYLQDKATFDRGVRQKAEATAAKVVAKTTGKRAVGAVSQPTCLAVLCRALGHRAPNGVTRLNQLPASVIADLCDSKTSKIGCRVYGKNDPRNHVELLVADSRTGTLKFDSSSSTGMKTVEYVVANPQEFFNKGGRFFNHDFYASEGTGAEVPIAQGLFGSDTMHSRAPSGNTQGPPTLFGGAEGFRGPSGRGVPRPPGSVVDESTGGGSNNISQGVTRARKRVVKGLASYNETTVIRRNYGVTGVTMFNNVEEMYLNTISREYAQEILEDLFAAWGMSTDEPEAMQYAEDLVWAFIVARTASNKADYNVTFEIPVKGGEVDADFSQLSRLLADKYGITRRNFARGVADDVRAYLNRPENQFIKSRSAQRVVADPQFGTLCFDGSTGCTNLTSAESTFCRLLEARNLYERDDVIAEGASEKLMQGLHGSVRSVVPR